MTTINNVTPVTIPELTSASALTGNEVLPVSQGGNAVKVTVSAIPQGIVAGVVTFGSTGGSPFPNYRTLKAGSNITITDAGAQGDLTISASGVGGGAVWGSVTGTITNQTDLQTSLATKLTKTSNLSDVTSTVAAVRSLGAVKTYQIVGTRTGVNGGAGFAPNASQAGMVHRIRHNLPYGCKTLQLVYGGFKVSGAVESSQGVGGGFESVSAVVAAGGASYVVGDTIVPTVAANQFAPTLVVQAISAGAVTQLGVVAGGMFGLQPAAALAQASTSGAGTGCTVTLTVKPYVCGLHVGLEQAWNTQTAYSTSALTGVLKLTYGANFNGTNANIMCPAGDFFYTDPVIADLTAGTYIGSRLWSNGFGYIGGRTLSGNDGSPALSEYANYSTMTDYAWGAVMPTQVTAYNNSGIQPLAIMGYIDTPRPSFVFMGDSITQNVTSNFGGSLTADSFDTQGNTGWLEKSSAQQVAWTNFSSGGDRVVNYLTAAQNMRLRAIQTFRPSHVVDTLAVNDLVAGTTFANFQAQKIAFWTKLRGLGVKEIWITTCTPVTTSTDSWATVGNQTVTAANTAIQLYNTWVRTLSNVTPYGVTAVLDVCASVESSAGSGKWLVAATYDGTHPSKTITTTIVSAQTAVFTGATL